MDIYDLRDELGHSGFDHVRIVDVNSYNSKRPNGGLLFEGDLEDTSSLDSTELDNAEITSIDIDFKSKTVTIDVDFGSSEDYVALSRSYSEQSEIPTPEGLKDLDEDETIENYEW